MFRNAAPAETERTEVSSGALAARLLTEAERYKRVAVVGAKASDVNLCMQAMMRDKRAANHSALYRRSHETAYLLKGKNVFEDLTVLDNILFRHRAYYSPQGRRELVQQCQEMLRMFNVRMDLHGHTANLTKEKMKIIELLRIYMMQPGMIISDDTMAEIGVNYTETFIRIINACRRRDSACISIYCTTRWEDAIKISDRIIVVCNGRIEQCFDTAEVRMNPRNLVSVLFGDHAESDKAESESYHEMFNVLFKGTGLVSSSFELASTLEFLANTIQRVLGTNGCAIFLNNTAESHMEVCSSGQDNPFVYTSVRASFEMNDNGGVLYATERNGTLRQYLAKDDGMVKTLLGLSTMLRSKNVIGYVLVWYDSYHVYSEKLLLLLSTFSNEVATVIETARLMNQTLLLQESHHRIKNNLQVISSLLFMQKRYLDKEIDEKAISIIDSTVNRIKSIAVVHDILTDTHVDQVVNTKELLTKVLSFYRSAGVTMHTSFDDIYIVQKRASSMALVINEIINNCVKHAFRGLPDSYERCIWVTVRLEDEDVMMEVRDNGVGMDAKAEVRDSFGLSIVHTLIEKEFKGRIFITTDKGTQVRMVVPRGNVFSAFTY